jgi:hypothetical protein
MVLEMGKTNTLTLEHNREMSSKSTEFLSGIFMKVNGSAVRDTRFAKFTRTFSRREEEIRHSHWIPLEKTLDSYHVAIRGSSRVLKGDLLKGCPSC